MTEGTLTVCTYQLVTRNKQMEWSILIVIYVNLVLNKKGMQIDIE